MMQHGTTHAHSHTHSLGHNHIYSSSSSNSSSKEDDAVANLVKFDTFGLFLDYIRIMAGIFMSTAMTLSLTYKLPDDKYWQLVSMWIFGLSFSLLYFLVVVMFRTQLSISKRRAQQQRIITGSHSGPQQIV